MLELYLLNPLNKAFVSAPAEDAKRLFPLQNVGLVPRTAGRLACLWILLLLFSAYMLSIVVYEEYLVRDWDRRFEQNGQPSIGEVLTCAPYQHLAEVQYQYAVGDMLLTRVRRFYPPLTCAEFPPGQRLNLRYLANDPQRVRFTDDWVRAGLAPSEPPGMMFWALCGLVMVILMFVGALYGLGRYFARRWRYWRLRGGELLVGELTAVSRRIDGRFFLTAYLDVRYQFYNAQGELVMGQQTVQRFDLIKDKDLPPIGTPLQILYVNDRLHFAL
jgi:hypothetical protein